MIFSQRKRVAAVGVAAAAALVLSACGGSDDTETSGDGGSGSGSADGITIGLITKTDTNPFFVKMREGAQESGPFFRNVDWTRTKAYALGLSGLYLNLRGREAQGIVGVGKEAGELKRALIEGLEALRDGGAAPIRESRRCCRR